MSLDQQDAQEKYEIPDDLSIPDFLHRAVAGVNCRNDLSGPSSGGAAPECAVN
jgi:hypothetical protein